MGDLFQWIGNRLMQSRVLVPKIPTPIPSSEIGVLSDSPNVSRFYEATPSEQFKIGISHAAHLLRGTISLEKIKAAGVDVDPLEYDFIYGYPSLASLPVVVDPATLQRKVPKRLALYVHLPFCSYSCSFCYFAKRIQPNESFVQDYLETLSREIDNAARWAQGAQIDSVYFGGGTPTYLSSEQLLWLVDLIYSSFNLATDYEWTVEASPETIDAAKAEAIVRSGVNRISIGVQSFHQEQLDDLSRKHTQQQATDAIQAILASGVKRHNVDLIYGFPGQTCEDLWHELEAISQLGLRSVTWYQLWQHMDTPLRRNEMRQRQMTAEEMLNLKCTLHEAMAAMGFQRDKVDWFVRDITESQRQQEHKWAGGDFLGLGLSAYGFVDGIYYRNHPNVRQYSEAVRRFGWGIGRGARLSPDQLVRRRLMLGIKTQGGVPLDVLRFASPGTQIDLHTRIDALLEAKLIKIEQQHLRLAELGQMYGDNVSNTIGLTTEDQVMAGHWRRYGQLG